MKTYEYIKIDNVFVCQIEDNRQLVHMEEDYTIYDNIKDNIVNDITLLFHVNVDNILDKIIKHTISSKVKQLILEKKINNYILFDFIFFVYILENNEEEVEDTLEGMTNLYEKFEKKIYEYRNEVVRNKSFNIKQRRISRKQLEQMQLNFNKWESESIF